MKGGSLLVVSDARTPGGFGAVLAALDAHCPYMGLTPMGGHVGEACPGLLECDMPRRWCVRRNVELSDVVLLLSDDPMVEREAAGLRRPVGRAGSDGHVMGLLDQLWKSRDGRVTRLLVSGDRDRTGARLVLTRAFCLWMARSMMPRVDWRTMPGA